MYVTALSIHIVTAGYCRQMVEQWLSPWGHTRVISLQNLAEWGYEIFAYDYWVRVTQMVRRAITLEIGMIDGNGANV